MAEIHQQLEDLQLGITDVAFACGSGGSSAGMGLGFYLYSSHVSNQASGTKLSFASDQAVPGLELQLYPSSLLNSTRSPCVQCMWFSSLLLQVYGWTDLTWNGIKNRVWDFLTSISLDNVRIFNTERNQTIKHIVVTSKVVDMQGVHLRSWNSFEMWLEQLACCWIQSTRAKLSSVSWNPSMKHPRQVFQVLFPLF